MKGKTYTFIHPGYGTPQYFETFKAAKEAAEQCLKDSSQTEIVVSWQEVKKVVKKK